MNATRNNWQAHAGQHEQPTTRYGQRPQALDAENRQSCLQSDSVNLAKY